jgi:hypothetical protein
MSLARVTGFVNDLDIGVGLSYRCNCPECGGKNTFTVTNSDGNILYNCYKAGCKVAGAVHRNMDAYTIKAKLMNENTSESYEKALQAKFETSPYITRMKPKSADVQDFLVKWNINPDDVLYDIRQDRVVFPVFTRAGLQVDAVGRSVLGRQPKWLRYASSPVPYTYGKSRTAVIVEDAISAYAVSNLVADQATGLALLGTQLTDFHKWYIKHYFDKVIVALDPDAADKTMSIAKELRSVVSDAKALRLTDDLKYMNEDDINQLKELL